MNKKKFVLRAVHKLRKPGYLGIHAVYSGFNQAFRDYYEDDPVREVDKLEEKGIVIKQPVKGGVMLYDYVEYKKKNKIIKKSPSKSVNIALKKILGE